MTDVHRVGPYRVERELGRGGMGTVYLAVRADDEYRKRVAIKVLRRGMETDDIVRRFRNERQILASIDHPHVAKLFDGGATDDGLPYFVMEYVDGRQIDDYCDAHRLSIADRLTLFRKVCSAVHFAHQNLVIHRDLKPENILVGADGQPKLLDFGIAKLLNPELAARTLYPTRVEMRLMTPEFASPEQARGEPITTASDVYSLGVLLYELLTGHGPYRLENRQLDEITRAICEEEPMRPSAAIDRIEEVPGPDGTLRRLTPEDVSRTREGTRDKLRRRLRGDLDNIVLTAMRKEPQRRYASVEQLSEDVARYLEGRPVLAQKGSWSYKSSKFVRRNRVGVAVAAAAVISLVAVSVITTRERNRAERALARAQKQEAKATAVSKFLKEMLAAPDPFEGTKRDVTVLELVDSARPKIQEAFRNEPETRAEMAHTLGATYFNLGLFEQARPLLEESVTILEQTLGSKSAELAPKLATLGNVCRAQNDRELAEELLKRALDICQASFGEEHPDTAQAFHDLGSLYWDMSRFAEAEKLYTRALAVREKVLGPDHADLGIVLNDLAVLHKQQGELEKAEPLYRRALAIEEKALGASHPEVATTLHNLGSLHISQGKLEEAESLFTRSLAIKTEALGPDHPFISDTLSALASVSSRKGEYARAEAYLRRALAIREKVYGRDHPQFGALLNNMGVVYVRQKKYAEAEPFFRRALNIREKGLPAEHPHIAESLHALARVYREQQKNRESAVYFERALGIYEKAMGPEHETTRQVREELAKLQGRER